MTKSKDIIQQLKDNERPFCMMSAEMQEKAKSVPARHLMCLTIESTAANPIWNQCEDGGIDWEDGENMISTFQLIADYAEEPEIEECEIRADKWNDLSYERDGDRADIDCAFHDPDFLGFKFEDGSVYSTPVKYKDTVIGKTVDGTHVGNIKSNDCKVLHATHVLFRRQP